MNWGHKISITFILFAIIIISMVVISMNQNIDLVAPNYYEEEIAYQDQIDRIKNYRDLVSKPTMIRHEDQLVLTFAEGDAAKIQEGNWLLYRPSEAGLDVKIPIDLNDQFQQIHLLQALKPGLWKMKLSWKTMDKEYFTEQSIII